MSEKITVRFLCKAKKSAKSAARYAKTHKAELLQIGVLGAVMLLPETGFAQSTSSSVSGFEAISGPLDKVKNFVTGPLAKTGATLGVAAGLGSWAMNFENQATKTMLRLTMGTGGLLGAAGLVDNVVGFMIP